MLLCLFLLILFSWRQLSARLDYQGKSALIYILKVIFLVGKGTTVCVSVFITVDFEEKYMLK